MQVQYLSMMWLTGDCCKVIVGGLLMVVLEQYLMLLLEAYLLQFRFGFTGSQNFSTPPPGVMTYPHRHWSTLKCWCSYQWSCGLHSLKGSSTDVYKVWGVVGLPSVVGYRLCFCLESNTSTCAGACPGLWYNILCPDIWGRITISGTTGGWGF